MALSDVHASPAGGPAFSIGTRIRVARKAVKLDQADLADACGVSRPLVSKWENDTSVPDLIEGSTIAHLTHVTLDWLAGFSEEGQNWKEIEGSPALRLIHGGHGQLTLLDEHDAPLTFDHMTTSRRPLTAVGHTPI